MMRSAVEYLYYVSTDAIHQWSGSSFVCFVSILFFAFEFNHFFDIRNNMFFQGVI